MDREVLGSHPLCWAHWPSSVLVAGPSNLPQEMRPPPQLCIYVGPLVLLLQIRESILLWACKWNLDRSPGNREEAMMAELKPDAHRSKTHSTDVLRGLPLSRAAASEC